MTLYNFWSRPAAGLICLSIGCSASFAAAPSTAPVDSAADAKVEAVVSGLMAKMTPQEKVLQLLSYCPNGVPRLGIPNLQAGEALHGVVSSGTTCFPQSIALAATWDPDAVRRMGAVIGQEARAVGVHQVFAPMLGVARDPRWGRVEESYGEDPYLAARMGVAYVQGVQGTGAERFGPDKVIATPKHFVADGEPWGGHNGESFDVSDRELREVYLRPFEAVVEEAGTGSIMPAHHQLNGVPCHANRWLLDTLLRKEWGFDGFVTSDMGDIPKLAGGHKYAVGGEKDPYVLALKAGVDMELVGKGYQTLLPSLAAGRITEEDLDRSARRVLKAKIRLLGLAAPGGDATAAHASNASAAILNYKGGEDIWAKLIAEGKFTTPDSARRPDAKAVLSNPEHDALALRLAEEAVVLLKNENALLPLDKAKVKRVLVVGPLGNRPNTGGYSGGGSKPYVTVVAGLQAELGGGGGGGGEVDFESGCDLDDASEVHLAAAVEKARDADVIVAVVGHTNQQTRENLDRDNLDLVGGQEKLIEAMKGTGKPVVVVLQNGSPLSVGWVRDNIPAVLETWYGGQDAGTAVARVLFGGVNPGGKMPVSVAKNTGQLPCFYNHLAITGPSDYYQSKWANLFVFGQGLSYTTFKYGDLRSRPGQGDQGPAGRRLRHRGEHRQRAGDEVVQLYVHQDYTSVERPVKQLEGFRRITLNPGEKQTVRFPVGFEQLRFWKDGQWVTEPGAATVFIGSSSDDIREKGQVEVGANP